MKHLLSAFSIAIAATTVFAQPVERLAFKDIYIGQNVNELREIKRLRCSEMPGRIALDEVCQLGIGVKETIAGVPATSVQAHVIDKQVHTILVYFSSADFTVVADALVERYGQPTKVEKSIVTTRAGVKYENETRDWRNLASGTLYIEKFGSRVDTSIVLFSSHDGDKIMEKRKKATSKSGSKDL